MDLSIHDYEELNELERWLKKEEQHIDFEIFPGDTYLKVKITVTHSYCVEHTYKFNTSTGKFTIEKISCWSSGWFFPVDRRSSTKEYSDDQHEIPNTEVFQNIIKHPDLFDLSD